MSPLNFAGIPQPDCECGAARECARFARVSIYVVGNGRAARLACAFDGYLCEQCGRVWAQPDPDYYGKPATAEAPERVEECDGGRDPWTLH